MIFSGGVPQLVVEAHLADSCRRIRGIGMSCLTIHMVVVRQFACRFIEMAASNTNVSRSVVFADPPGSDRFVAATVPLKEMNNEFMNTSFTKAVGCQAFKGGCEAMQKYYRFSEHVPMGEHWRHKYLLDLDGMGYSARVMALLASDSAVIKTTIYREFFTEWIQPWCVPYLYMLGSRGSTDACLKKVTLYPPFTILQGDIQHSCFLLWGIAFDAQSRQLLIPHYITYPAR